MIRLRKLYFDNQDSHDIELACRISKLRCELASENQDLDKSSGWTSSYALKHALRKTVSKRHLPVYTLELSTSKSLDEGMLQALTAVTKTQRRTGATTPEAAVSPVALFRGAVKSDGKVKWTLVSAGLIQTLTINRGFDQMDGSLCDVNITVLDLRLETDFLQAVDVKKMKPPQDTIPERRKGRTHKSLQNVPKGKRL